MTTRPAADGLRPRIRLAHASDRAAAEAIVTAAYQPWVGRIGARPAPMDADYAALIHAGAVHVLEAGESVGVIVLVPEADTLLVENVAVRPEHQGSGYGRSLLEFADDTAHRLQLGTVRLFTHELMVDNIRLYERLGYQVAGREPVEAGHVVHLRKALGGVPRSAPDTA